MHAILIAGAALVGLPILLHLIMKQEPKRLSFPAFRFLTQKLKTNQRKLRLRHFILLALRMLIIALFCLTLYQPTLKSDRLNIRGEQPVATIIAIDTSPSMGYTQNDKTRLEDACQRALELLNELPEKSPVAVVPTDDPGGGHWTDITEARKLIEELKKQKPRGGIQPLTSAIGHAYQLFAKIESKDTEETEQLPKLLFAITDRAAACWDSGRVDELKKSREKIPDPKPAHAVVDVGAEKPMNVGILSAEMKPQIIAANQPAIIVVTVAATGPSELPPVEATITAKLDGTATTERREARVGYGQTRAVTFEFKNLKPGLHQLEFNLVAADQLMFDNTRFLTFKVGETRRVLTIADDPAAAGFWQEAIRSKGEFDCLVVSPSEVRIDSGNIIVSYPDPAKPGNLIPENIRAFDVVCLFGVDDPSKKTNGDSLWDKVRPYVEGGGKLVIIPGERLSVDGFKAGGNLMPGEFKSLIETDRIQPPPPKQSAPGWRDPRDGANGVTWVLDEKSVQHPMLRPFQGWSASRDDVIKDPRRARKYWEVKKADEAATIVFYNDAEKAADRRPAVLERGVPDPKEPAKIKGRVLLLTTRMDIPVANEPKWNDYWEFENSWCVVFPTLVVRYLAGDTADANFNYQVGQTLTVPLPKGGLPRGTKVAIDNPNIQGNDALIEVGDKQTELRLGPPRLNQPGNFALSLETETMKWRDGFSLNVPAEESTLDKVPIEGIEDLTGKGSVFPLSKDKKLIDIVKVIADQPIDLFPWLLIGVLMLLATEGLVANRFYRKVK
jgi:Aerotolerance regulator N-terminal/von Willebrand factor type A domain